MRLFRWAAPYVAASALALVITPTVLGQDSDEVLKAPGLIAEFFTPADAPQPSLVRYEAVPGFTLEAGETIDSRLPARGWRVRYRGVLDVQQQGIYRFSSVSTGAVRLTIDGQEVCKATGAGEEDPPRFAIELSVGYYPLVIDYEPPAGPARLSLFWESDSVAREPLAPHAVGHLPNDSAARDDYLLGRLAFEEHSCIACHGPSVQAPLSLALAARKGPRLEKLSGRLHANWLYAWLGDPQAFRPEAVMPRLFPAGRTGEVERYAVSRYLTADGPGLASADAQPSAQQIAEGRLLYERTGCVICHEPQQLSDEVTLPPRATLAHLAAKTTLAPLASFLHDPYAIDPSGRMPKFGLSPEQSQAIAAYLLSRDEPGALPAPADPQSEELRATFAQLVEADDRRQAFAGLNREQQLSELARESIKARRCASCHDFGNDQQDELQPRATTHDFAAIGRAGQRGCLSQAEGASDAQPRFGAALSRQAVADFLQQAQDSPGVPSRIEQSRLTFMRFNCTGCHERNGEGGLSATLHRLLTENQSAAEADLIRPPTLTGIAAKLHSAALAAVLLHGERARPWMALKMPHFASEHVAPLVAALPALEGHIPAEPSAPSSPDAELSKAGRALVGSQGFGCIKCHDIRGIPTSGTRGPDLARVGQRIRRDWYERWMTDPQRIEPGTRMPTVFFGGQSPYKNVLDGNPERQIAAIWHYLSAGNELELPEGLETPGGGKPLIASGQPLVMRTFLPNVSPRALAIQFPNQVHVAFDAQTCRVAYAWRGDFLDMSPVWTGRGGRPAELAGELLWTAPAGFPWAITPTAQQEVPDFAAQAADVEVGALPPDDGRVYASRLRFRGYRVAPQGPVLQYVLRQGDGQILQFEQSLRTRSDARGQSVEQQFVVQSPGNARLWLHPAQSDRPPELLTGGTATPLADNRDVPALETAIAIHQAERTLICQVRDCTTDQARWRAVRAGDQWSLVLMLDISQQPLRVDLETIAPSDDRPEATAAWLRNADSPAQQ